MMKANQCRYCGDEITNRGGRARHEKTCFSNPKTDAHLRKWLANNTIEIDGVRFFPSMNAYKKGTVGSGLPSSQTLVRMFGDGWDGVRKHYAPDTKLQFKTPNTDGSWKPEALADLQALAAENGGAIPTNPFVDGKVRHQWRLQNYSLRKFCNEHGLEMARKVHRGSPEWKALRTTQPPSAQALGKERDDYAESWGMPAKEGVRRWLDRSGQMCEQIVYMLV